MGNCKENCKGDKKKQMKPVYSQILLKMVIFQSTDIRFRNTNSKQKMKTEISKKKDGKMPSDLLDCRADCVENQTDPSEIILTVLLKIPALCTISTAGTLHWSDFSDQNLDFKVWKKSEFGPQVVRISQINRSEKSMIFNNLQFWSEKYSASSASVATTHGWFQQSFALRRDCSKEAQTWILSFFGKLQQIHQR